MESSKTMFKKPKKNFRSRRTNDNSDEENNSDDDVMIIEPEPPRLPKPVVPVKKAKRKKKDKDSEKAKAEHLPKSASGSTLSFDDGAEEDGEMFQIKKSSRSRRIAKMHKHEHKREKEEKEAQTKTDTLISAPGMYSAQNLRKLRQEQENGHSTVDMELGSDVDPDPDEDCIKRPTFDDDDGADENDDDKDKEVIGGNLFSEMIARGEIPDASLIHMVRKKRQAARERGDDYIPLDEEKASNKPGSRLIREEDHDKSDDEDEHIEFNADRHEQELRRMHNTILEHEQGSHSEGSDQEAEWEKQQIRKGVKTGLATQEVDDISKQYQQFYFGAAPPLLPPTTSTNPTPILATRAAPPENLPPVTVDIIKKRLTDRLENLDSVHRAHLHERDDIVSRMENISVTDQPGGKKGLEERYKFFQEMRGYVGDLIECLSEKTTSISYIDRCMMNQWQTRASKIIQRRQQDVKDQSLECLTKKAQPQEPLDEKLEESRRRRAAEREARRSRRRRARENRGVLDHYDGLSTDDEENKSETIKLNMEREHIHSQVRTMFQDVVEEFHNLNLIKGRFEEWKYGQGDSYDEAYIGLCLPKLFTPYIKLSLITWNPLEENAINYEEMSWYESLMFYGYQEGKGLLRDDVDVKLMPSIVEKILLPKITALVETVWDPMSNSQTRRLVKLVKSFIDDYPTITCDSKHTQLLIQTVAERLKKSLDDDVFMPLFTSDVLENKLSVPTQFFHRQFWTCVKLLGNIFEWQSILSDVTLQKLGLICLLNRYIVIALRTSAVNSDSLHKCQVVVSMIPKCWFIHIDGLSTIPLLEIICKYLNDAANTLEKATPNDKDCRLIARENLKAIRKMLISIHAMDHASNLADKMVT